MSAPLLPFAARCPRHAPWRLWAALGAAVLAGHGWLLGRWTPEPSAAPHPRALSVRSLTAATAPAAAAPVAAAIRPAAAALPVMPVMPVAPQAVPPSSVTATAAAAAAVAEVATPTPPGGEAPPLYPTQLPPAVVLSYALDRGGAAGSAELRWQPGDDGYTLTLSGGRSAGWAFELASRGTVDAAGVAPDRFTDRRRRSGVLAVNFQRDSGRISFSRPALEWPLPEGAQDRLSWMLQLPAVVAADPARFAAGAQVQLFVVGARGDAETWVFEVLGSAPLELPAGRVDAALQLRREPRRPHDQRVEVWLDPARHHLPVQMRMTPLPGGPPMELRLRATDPPARP